MPSRLRALVVVVAVAGSLSCAGRVTPPATPDVADAGIAAPVDPCVAGPSSGDLALTTVEAEPGYDAALAALDVTALPSTIPLDGLPAFEATVVGYMLDAPATDAVVTDAAATTAPGRAVLGAFASSGDGSLDFTFLRRGFHRTYACDRGFPITLAGFRTDVADFTLNTQTEIVDSTVKQLRRRIRRDAVTGVFVAETLLDDDTVRETEIIMTDRRADQAIDFVEYDRDGNIRGASEFANASGTESIGAVPFTCMACHSTNNVSPAAP